MRPNEHLEKGSRGKGELGLYPTHQRICDREPDAGRCWLSLNALITPKQDLQIR